MQYSTKVLSAAAIAGLCAVSLGTGAVAQSGPSVTVNGSPVTLVPAPTERAGRVFVPLRGVFEKLGASVVYAGGQINATGNGRSIGLRIGSTAATINGAPQNLDVAPFIIGASTYVPLRFVAQALGATVNYDNGNRIVAISTNGAVAQNPPPQTVTAQPAPGQRNTVQLIDLKPARNGSAPGTRPAIGARFSEPVDIGSVKITLDSRDVSAQSFLNESQFDFTPPYDLPADTHTVRVTGKSRDGVPFDRSWQFAAAGAAAPVTANYIRELVPASGTAVGGSFRVSGTTLPNSKVRIAAAGGATIGGILRIGGGTYVTDTSADGNGRFAVDVTVSNLSGGDITLRVQSVSSQGQGANATVQLRSQ